MEKRRRTKDQFGTPIVTITPFTAGVVDAGEGAIVSITGFSAGSVVAGKGSVVPVDGAQLGNLIVGSPAIVEGYGLFLGNIEVADPSLAEFYAIDTLSLYFASPAVLTNVQAIKALVVEAVNPTVTGFFGIDARNNVDLASPEAFGARGHGMPMIIE